MEWKEVPASALDPHHWCCENGWCVTKVEYAAHWARPSSYLVWKAGLAWSQNQRFETFEAAKHWAEEQK